MRFLNTILALVVLSVSCLASVPPYLKGPRPEQGSFLNHPARNLSEVIGQIKGDKEVADRLTRHFKMSRAELVAFLGTLHLTGLKKEGAYMVYNVRDDGVIRARAFNLPAGMLIYADSMGKPILRHKCANPMTLGPKANSVNESEVATGLEEVETRQLASEVDTIPSNVDCEVLEPANPTPLADSTPLNPVESPIEQITIVSGGGSNFFGLLGLGMLGALGALGSQSSNGTPVPEPGTVIALFGGLAVVYWARRK